MNLNSLKIWKSKLDRSDYCKSKVFCMAPWVNLHITPHGEVFPCAISAHYLKESQGNMRKSSLKEIWNSPKMKSLRTNMMLGKKSKQCELCYQYERVGQTSPRQDFNQKFGNQFDLEHNTASDGTLEKFELKFIDFRFSNLCNFRCRICSHHFSTSWFTESVKLGVADKNDKRLVVPMDDPKDIWNQIEPILLHLDHIHFAGGEPLIMEEHYRILNYLVEHKRFKVKLSYNTNFSETHYKGQDVMLLWKKFKDVTVCASLDGMGKRAELMRKGQSWKQTVENRERMLRICPRVRFVLTPAVGVLNVLHLPDFYLDWVNKKLLVPEEIKIYLVFEPEFYSIQTLPQEFKDKIHAKYEEFFSNSLNGLKPKIRDKVIGQFLRVLEHLYEDEKFKPDLDSYHRQTFTSFNNKLDELRNEDVLSVFPELRSLYSNDRVEI